MITLVWAQDIKKGIGIDNLLPWKLKDEMDHFKKVTHNQIVVMGQKTFESIGKPLINRLNVVISDDKNFERSDVKIFRSIQDVINEYKNHHIYVIGGKSIYETFAPLADEFIVSKLKNDYKCNRFLDIDFTNFKLEKSIHHEHFIAEWWSRK